MSFWQAKTKLRPTDVRFSNYIRERDNWHCQYRFKCSGLIDFRANKGGLTTSHFHKRRKESVRFDPENSDAACRPCHRFVEDTPEGQQALKAWKLNQLGEQRYKLLEVRAQTPGHRDDFLTSLYIKQLNKDLNEKRTAVRF